jgi:superfamily II DNA or RNA helicase
MKGFTPREHQKEALDLMSVNSKVRIIAPTSAGKSLIIFGDIYNKMQNQENSLFVVVSSRILLLQQLSHEFTKYISTANIVHTHSGDTGHKKIKDFLQLAYWAEKTEGPKVIFVTYHSLHKIAKAELDVDAVYLDECHNGAKRHFFEYVKDVEKTAKNFYSFTATPRYHKNPTKNGNNNVEVYGDTVYNVNAVTLIKNGSILPPNASPFFISDCRDKKNNSHERDYYTLMDIIINGENTDRVLITCPSTKAMMALLSMTDFIKDLQEQGYDLFHITSKYGAFHNNVKLKRSDFLSRIEEYGKENKKFVVMHYSILTEGWSNNSIQSSVFMREQSMGSTVQNIGRNLRIAHEDLRRIESGELIPGDYDNYVKPYGEVIIPVYKNTGSRIQEQVESVITEVFTNGNYVYDVIEEPKTKKACAAA